MGCGLGRPLSLAAVTLAALSLLWATGSEAQVDVSKLCPPAARVTRWSSAGLQSKRRNGRVSTGWIVLSLGPLGSTEADE
jgi:hypothetical protein